MKYSSTQVVKRFLSVDSPVKPGSSLIVKGSDTIGLPATATELLAVKKSLPEGNIEYAAACLGLVPCDNASTPWTDEIPVPAAA